MRFPLATESPFGHRLTNMADKDGSSFTWSAREMIPECIPKGPFSC
ncbi:unnamed protein product [Larinioides sclopetarius]|uniref:Uncharacterized protein n=1 Tax=Larinioides sclopetarius TaxID=280406 RepID=A0AAV2B8K3_9ARAC